MPEILIIASVLLILAVTAFGLLFLHIRNLQRQAHVAWSELLARRREWLAVATELREVAEGHGVAGSEAVIQSVRRASVDAATPGQRAAADEAVGETVEGLVQDAERIESARTDVRWRELQSRLGGAREALGAAAQSYNAAVESYNRWVVSWLATLLYRWSGMREAEPYKA